MEMSRQRDRQRLGAKLALACAILVGLALFALGLDLFEMWLIVLVSYYTYWILRMD